MVPSLARYTTKPASVFAVPFADLCQALFIAWMTSGAHCKGGGGGISSTGTVPGTGGSTIGSASPALVPGATGPLGRSSPKHLLTVWGTPAPLNSTQRRQPFPSGSQINGSRPSGSVALIGSFCT